MFKQFLSPYQKEKIFNDILSTILVAAFLTIIIALCAVGMAPKHSPLSQKEISHIEKQLTKKYADDCVLEPSASGWSCKEIKTGKVFKVSAK